MVSWLALVAPSARTSEAGRLAFSTVVLCYTAFHSTCVIQRYSNGKTCLPKRKMVSTLTSCDVNHVLKWTRLSVHISAVGSKVMRKYIRGEPGVGKRGSTRRVLIAPRRGAHFGKLKKCHLRRPEIENLPGGACPQTPLGGALTRAGGRALFDLCACAIAGGNPPD